MCKFCQLQSIFSNPFSRRNILENEVESSIETEKISFAIEQISHLEKESVEGNGSHQG